MRVSNSNIKLLLIGSYVLAFSLGAMNSLDLIRWGYPIFFIVF